MAGKRVSVRLVAEGGRLVRSEFQGVGEAGEASFKRIEKQADINSKVVRRVMGVLGAAISVQQRVTWTDLRSRVDLATGSREKGAAVMQRLAAMARQPIPASSRRRTSGWPMPRHSGNSGYRRGRVWISPRRSTTPWWCPAPRANARLRYRMRCREGDGAGHALWRQPQHGDRQRRPCSDLHAAGRVIYAILSRQRGQSPV